MRLIHNFLLLPHKMIDVSQFLNESGKTTGEIEQTITTTGITKIRYAEDTLMSEFVLNGLNSISQNYDRVIENVDAIVVVSQSYDERIPSISTRLQKLMNLPSETFCIDIMDGCSGFIKALSIASMLFKNGSKKILIVAGDLNSRMTRNAEIGTKILFGDGLSVSIFEDAGPTEVIKIFNDGDTKGTISCNTEENVMYMNGFEVFRFTRNVVPKLIKNYLEETGNDITGYDLVALHQASNLVVSTICKAINVKNSLNDNFACSEIGNLGAGSIGAWLSQAEHLPKGKDLKMLAVGFGSGLSWGAASVTINLKHNEVIYV